MMMIISLNGFESSVAVGFVLRGKVHLYDLFQLAFVSYFDVRALGFYQGRGHFVVGCR